MDPFADLAPPVRAADPFADLGPPRKATDPFVDLEPLPPVPEPDAFGMVPVEHPLDLALGAGASSVDLSKGIVQSLAGGLGAAGAIPSAIYNKQPEIIPQTFEKISSAFPMEPVWNAILPEQANVYRKGINIPVSELATFPQASENLGDIILEKTGSPTIAAAAATLLQALPIGVMSKTGAELLKKGGKAAVESVVSDIPQETLYKTGQKTTYTRADLQKILTQDPTADPVLYERVTTDPAFKQTLVDALRKGDLSVEELHPNWLGKILGKEPITTETPTETPPPASPKGALPAEGETGVTPAPTGPDLMPGGQGGVAEPLPGTILETKTQMDAANAVATKAMWERQGFDATIEGDPSGLGHIVTRRVKGYEAPTAPDPFADLAPVSTPEGTQAPSVERAPTPQAVGTPWTVPSPGPAAGPEPFTERRVAQTSGPRERREDLATRKKIDEMTPEEQSAALRYDEKTGLKSHRAFLEEADTKPVKVAFDMNGLKWINDNLGHAVGDDAIRAVADAIHAAHGDGYRISGDELAILADHPAAAKGAIAKIRDILKETEIIATRPDGTEARFKGLTITRGIGGTIDEAFTTLNADKEAAIGRGDRSKERGGRPLGLLEVATGGNEVPVQTPGPHAQLPTRPEGDQEVAHDKENVPGVPSNLPKGETPVKTEPVTGGGEGAPRPGGDVQAHEGATPAQGETTEAKTVGGKAPEGIAPAVTWKKAAIVPTREGVKAVPIEEKPEPPEGGTKLYASPLDPELIAQAWQSLKHSTAELKERHRLAKSAKGLDLNWFNKKVNTPYYVFTEKFPRYRGVFDRMRQMMQERDDIAASLAEDAISFFSGLEFKEKDAVNKLLIKGRYQRKVWTRDELVEEGKLSTKQIDAYLGIRAMLDRALDIYEDGIMYRITKGKMQASSNLSVPLIKDSLVGLGFDDDRIEQIAALIGSIRETKRKGYAPFARFGNFSYGYVHVKEDGTPDWQNPSNYFAKEETAWKAAEKYQVLLKRFHKGISEGRLIPVPPKELKQTEEAKLLQEIGGFELDVIKKIMALDPEAAASLKETVEQFFQAQGFRRHFFESKDSPGFSTDMERALADYIVSLSGFVSRIKGIPEMDNAAAGMERIPDLARYYREWKNYSISPQEEFHQLRAGLFLYFLGGNVKSAAINLTQTFVTTIPWLTQYVSPFRATEEVTRAMKDLTTAMGKREDGTFGVVVDKLPKDIREIVRRGYDEGIVSEQLIYDLMGTVRKPSSIRKLSKQKQRAVRGFGYLFSLAEKSNRLISLIAAARIHQSLSQKHAAKMTAFDAGGGGKEPPKPPGGGGAIPFEEDPFEFGKRATDETQFIYAKYNRPAMFRGWGSLLGTFRTFVINFLEFLARLWNRDSLRAVGSVFVMLWAFSGILGMPFAENVKYILEEVAGMITHKKPDLETAVREWGYENMGGPEFMDYLLHGPFRQATGFDISASVGVGDVLPFFDRYFARSPIETVIGAPAEVLLNRPARAYGFLKEGRPYRAAETVAPEFLRNPMYAGRILKEGVLDRSGGQIVAKKAVSGADVAKKALGFIPTQIAKAYERERAKARIGERSEQLKKDATRALLNAIRIGDRQKAVSILKSTGPKPGVPPEEWIILNEQAIEKSLENTLLPPELRGLLRQPNLQRPAFLRMNKVYGGK